jgi:hypothetical protein
MKPTLLGLIVSAAAFAGSTYYFWQQLRIERDRADEVAAQSETLKQRIAELEQLRGEMGSFEFSGSDSGPIAPPVAAKSNAPTPGQPAATGSGTESQNVFQVRPQEPSPAMLKMMRGQLRANNKRLYADLVAQMGLSDEDANKFYDLLTDQQTVNFGPVRGLESDEARAKLQQSRKQTQDAIGDLLGADRLATYQEYQETMSVRAEVDMIARQLEGLEHSLSAEQRKKLVAAMVEEQKRVPRPEYSSFGDAELYGKALTDWETQYNERATDRARSILDGEQFTSYSEYQQWQREMRENFKTMPGRPRMRGGNSISFTAAPAFAAPVTVPAPPPSRDDD